MELRRRFRLCPHCGKKLQIKNRLVACTSCDFKFYFSPAVTNAVILTNTVCAILLVKRKTLPKRGFWDLPGGFVEFAETAEESVRREIEEELRIRLSHFAYLTSYADRYRFTGINYHTLGLIYVGRVENKVVHPSDDITDARFFSTSKIPFPRLAFPSIKKAIKLYLSSSH